MMVDEVVRLPEYTELIPIAEGWEYGTIHTHDEISDIMKLSPKTAKYYGMVGRANKKLMQGGKMLVNVKEKGYQVVNPDDYTDKSLEKFKQGANKIRQAHIIVDYAPVTKMSETGLKRYRNYADRLGIARAIMEGSYKEVSILARQPMQLNSGRN
jgi:hypothetical protein